MNEKWVFYIFQKWFYNEAKEGNKMRITKNGRKDG